MSFEFKLKSISVDNLSKEVVTLFNKVIANPQMLNEIGESIKTDIKNSTQVLGKSIPQGNKDLKLLKESWITRKIKLSETNHTDEFYEEGKSRAR
jgi:hypothetical protein